MLSKHLTPAMFAAEARKPPRPVPIFAVHIKPRFYEQVVAQLAHSRYRAANRPVGRVFRVLSRGC